MGLKEKEYHEKNDYLGNWENEEVETEDFYRSIFPVGTFERKGMKEDKKPNGIVLEIIDKKGEKPIPKREIVTDDHEGFMRTRENFSIFSPISYYGNRRTAQNARYIHSLVFDLDGVRMKNLIDLLHQIDGDVLPQPTIIVNSGTGLHLYYHFENPIPMYPQNRKYLGAIKNALTGRIWNDFTSSYKEVQRQGIMQGFRLVGSPSKLGVEFPVKAFWIKSGKKWTVEGLKRYIPDIPFSGLDQIKILEKKSQLSLEEAKEKYPDWYEKKVIGKGEESREGRWNVKRDLYDWWLRRIRKEIQTGHRYFAIMTLAIYAQKCNIEEHELYADAFSLFEPYERLTKEDTNHFKTTDIVAGLEMYNEDYITFPRDEIAKLSGLAIVKNKRNGRKRDEHLELVNHMNAYKRKKGESLGAGRPSVKEIVVEWRAKNPNGKKADCIRGTGLGQTTVNKYWKLEDKL